MLEHRRGTSPFPLASRSTIGILDCRRRHPFLAPFISELLVHPPRILQPLSSSISCALSTVTWWMTVEADRRARSFASGSIITFYEPAYGLKVTKGMHLICRGCGTTLWAIWRTNTRRYGFTARRLRRFRGRRALSWRTFAGTRAIRQ